MKQKLPTAADLKFESFDYSDEFPPMHCNICGGNIKPTGALKADVKLWEGVKQPLTLVVCNEVCHAVLKGPKAGATTAFIIQEVGRLKRLFPKKD